MENLYSTSVLIGSTEPSHLVYVYNYDYSSRKMSEDQYWDEGLEVDLDEGGSGCNVSFASSPLIGARKPEQWCNTGPSNFAMIANRGPAFGNVDDNPHSITYEIHGGGRAWAGNVCWQDNHVSYEETLFPQMSILRDTDGSVPDNLFNIDCVSGFCHFWGSDAWLVIVSELSDTGSDMYPYQLQPELEWDE
jgi:hypothetical protein